LRLRRFFLFWEGLREILGSKPGLINRQL